MFGESGVIIDEACEIDHIADDRSGNGTTGIEQCHQYGVAEQLEDAVGNAGIAH